jgi:hypothetical protein
MIVVALAPSTIAKLNTTHATRPVIALVICMFLCDKCGDIDGVDRSTFDTKPSGSDHFKFDTQRLAN